MDEITKKIIEQYPECTDEMMKNDDIAFDLFCKKQADYGPGNIELGLNLPQKNGRAEHSSLPSTRTQENQLLAQFGVTVRMNDKVQRLLNLQRKELKDFYRKTHNKPQNEPIEDSLLDLKNYTSILQALRKGKWGK